MNERDLFRALGDIDDDLLAGAEKTTKKIPWKRYIPTLAAACLCIVALFLGVRILGERGLSDSANMESLNDLSNSGTKYAGSPAEHATVSDGEISFQEDEDAAPGDLTGATTPPAAGTMGNYGLAEQPEGQAPADFTFRLDWGEGTYDSATQTLTEGTQTCKMKLTEQEMGKIWNLLVQMGQDPDAPGGWKLVWSVGGEENTWLLPNTSGQGQYSLAQALLTIIQDHADSLR